MIVEYLRYTISEAQQAAFIFDYKNASVPLLSSPYCQGFEFCQCVEDSTQFIIRIQWTSGEDHLNKFRGSKEFKDFFVHIKPYLNDIDEMRHYNKLS